MKLFFTNHFYWTLVFLITIFVTGYFVPPVYPIAMVLLGIFILLVITDFWLLFFTKGGIVAKRVVRERFSNGDDNEVRLHLRSNYSFPVEVTVLDEIPYQFQAREFSLLVKIKPGEALESGYSLKPVERGTYQFGNINCIISTTINLVLKRKIIDAKIQVKVYPSFIKLNHYGLLAISQSLTMAGQKRLKKAGHSTEFDTISNYVIGDDPRHINWRATARKGQLMINHYVDEKAQNIYCLIDKSRSMKMPFEEMTLLDHSINASLVLSDISLKRGDKAGLLTFEDSVDSFVKATNRNIQVHRIMETLYGQVTSFSEPDFGTLYSYVRKNINQRSLLMLFTNFESIHSLKRQIKYLELLNRKHLLLVIYFRNTEVDTILKEEANTTREIYEQSIAYNLLDEKLLIRDALVQSGILSLYTKPRNLNVDVINKYIQIKSRQMI